MCGQHSIRSCGRTPRWKCCREFYGVGYRGSNAWGKAKRDEGFCGGIEAFRPDEASAVGAVQVSPVPQNLRTLAEDEESREWRHVGATEVSPALKRWAKPIRAYDARAKSLELPYHTSEFVRALTLRRAWILTVCAALILLLVLPSAAQLAIGDNLNMNANGVVSLGYNDVWGNTFSSNHSLDLGGSGTLSGYYYNPNFLNFQVSPYYNRSQANSESQSIFNTSGIETSANLFSGSHFPGSVGYSKGWNSEGNFGLPGTPNYTTYGSGQSFNVGWGAFLPGLPSLLATYNRTSSEYTVLGTNENGNNSYQNFGLRSNYTIAGFNLNAAYTLGDSVSFIPEVFGNQPETFTSNNNSLQVGASHVLPMHGSVSASFTRSYLDTNYLGYIFNGTIDSVNVAAGISPTSKLNFAFNMGYTDNFVGSFYQSILPPGTAASQAANGAQAQSSQASGQAQQGGGIVLEPSQESSNALYLTGYGAYAVARNTQLTFEIQHREQSYLGKTYAADTYGAGAIYQHELFRGFLHGSLNFADNTSNTTSGNALSFAADGGWNRTFSEWVVSVNGGYAQNVENYLVSYLNSYYLYSGSVRHKFGRIIWTASAAGSHTAIVNQPHTGSGGQSYATSLGARRLTASASYAKTSGYGLLSGGGITLPPGLPPGQIPPEWLLFYGGSSYSFALGTSPIRHLTFGASFTRTDSNTLSGLTFSANHSEQIIANGNYLFRKLTFSGGYSRVVQGFSASGVPAANANSIYFGVSRYFNFF